MRACRKVNPPDVVGGVGEVGLGACVGDEREVAVHRLVGKHDGVGGPAVEALLDRSHTSGTGDLQQPDIGQHVDMVGDGATWLANSGGKLGDGHRPFQHQVEDECSQRVAQCLQSGRGVGDDRLVEVVAQIVRRQGRPYVRHISNDKEKSDISQPSWRQSPRTTGDGTAILSECVLAPSSSSSAR